MSENGQPEPVGPLSGILVVSMDHAVAAPYCASRLADAGARVIKIERRVGTFLAIMTGPLMATVPILSGLTGARSQSNWTSNSLMIWRCCYA